MVKEKLLQNLADDGNDENWWGYARTGQTEKLQKYTELCKGLKNKNGYTALMYAARNGHKNCVEHLS